MARDTHDRAGGYVAEALRPCAYCQVPTPEAEFTLEHAIPQFLGGAQAPEVFRLHNVCQACNNNLGTFVDGAYAKSWPVSQALAHAARRLYVGGPRPLPLWCIGQVQLDGVELPTWRSEKHAYVQEMWVGPSGETLLWLRPQDDQTSAYVGGNPLHKRLPATAYWLPTSNDPMRLHMGFQSVATLRKGRPKMRLVLGCRADDPDCQLSALGFVDPDDVDQRNLQALRAACQGDWIRARIALQPPVDPRFLSKLALGVGLAVFGTPFETSHAARELRRGVWPRGQGNIAIRGQGGLGLAGSEIAQHCSLPGAVVLAVLQIEGDFVLTLTINATVAATVALAPATLAPAIPIGEAGYALILVPYLDRAVETTLADLLAHRLAERPLPALEFFESQIARALTFNAQLTPMAEHPDR